MSNLIEHTRVLQAIGVRVLHFVEEAIQKVCNEIQRIKFFISTEANTTSDRVDELLFMIKKMQEKIEDCEGRIAVLEERLWEQDMEARHDD